MTKYKVISQKLNDGNIESGYLSDGVPINTALVESRQVDFRLNEISGMQKAVIEKLGLNRLETSVELS